MSAPSESSPPRAAGVQDPGGRAPGAAPHEQREALPVLARRAPALEGRSRELALAGGAPSLLQAAAAAAGGFLAGAAVAGIVHRRHARVAPARPRRLVRRARLTQAGGRSPARTGELVQIVGSRSLLVDVHLLGER